MFVKLMMASPMPDNFEFKPNTYAVEEKIDGIRLEVEVSDNSDHLFTQKGVTPWSRYGILHPVPTHISEVLAQLPNGIYDGELYVPGKRSYGATEIVNRGDLILDLFDILQLNNQWITDYNYDTRRLCLQDALQGVSSGEPVRIVPSYPFDTWEQVESYRDTVWARDGEGLILKKRISLYQIGKRPKDWIKIKQLQPATLSVIGFVPSRGQINDRGLFATVVVQDEEGCITTVKTRNDAECRKFELEAPKDALMWREVRFNNKPIKMIINHPAVGRKLCIEFQERTPDGNYRHPRWDRWSTE